MIDPDPREQAALSEQQALGLATAAVDGFQEAMRTSAPAPRDMEVPF